MARGANLTASQVQSALILESMRSKGYVWRKSEGYPKEFLPGDFICTLGHGGGHSGIVVERGSTRFVPGTAPNGQPGEEREAKPVLLPVAASSGPK